MKISLKPSFQISWLVQMFIFSDLALLAGWGLITPVFGIFIIDEIQGATLISVGVAAAIYWMVKSVIQIPIAVALDKNPGEKDDFIVLVSGLVIISLTAFSFALVDRLWQLYLVQILHAVGFAMYAPSWLGIFSRHIDKSHESFEWAMDNTAISFASGVTGLLSGILAAWIGFSAVFIIVGVFSFIAAAVIFIVPRIIFPRRSRQKGILRNHRPPSHA